MKTSDEELSIFYEVWRCVRFTPDPISSKDLIQEQEQETMRAQIVRTTGGEYDWLPELLARHSSRALSETRQTLRESFIACCLQIDERTQGEAKKAYDAFEANAQVSGEVIDVLAPHLFNILDEWQRKGYTLEDLCFVHR